MKIGSSFAEAERSNSFCFRHPPIKTEEDIVQFDLHLSSIGNRAFNGMGSVWPAPGGSSATRRMRLAEVDEEYTRKAELRQF